MVMITTLSTVEVYQVVCGDCNKPFFEPDEGLLYCPHCGEPTQSCLMKDTHVYPVLINPSTGEAELGKPIEKLGGQST